MEKCKWCGKKVEDEQGLRMHIAFKHPEAIQMDPEEDGRSKSEGNEAGPVKPLEWPEELV